MDSKKIITLSRIGWNHPSQANWSWGIWKLDLIDPNQGYCMSHTLKEQFGGDSRLKRDVEEKLGHKIIETKGSYPQAKVTGIRSMLNMESEEVLNIIRDFLAD